jgi:hypothetical protein
MNRSRDRTMVVIAALLVGALNCAPSRCPPAAATAAAPPSSSPAASPDVHERTAAEVLAALKNHDFDAVERNFDRPMQRDVPRDAVERVWSSAVASKGEMTSWKLIGRDSSAGYDRLRFELNHESGKLQALIVFAADGSHVAGMLIQPLPTR